MRTRRPWHSRPMHDFVPVLETRTRRAPTTIAPAHLHLVHMLVNENERYLKGQR